MKILFIHQGMAPFIEKDLHILRGFHEVKGFCFKGARSIFSLLKEVKRCDLTFSWFGSIHAFWAVLFSRIFDKRSIVVAGGYDVGQEDGLWSQPLKSWCPQYVFSKTDKILTVSNFCSKEAIEHLKVKPEKVKMIYHGFDQSKYSRGRMELKENMVLTISQVAEHQIQRKGLDLFIKTAALMKDTHFVIVGAWLDDSVKSLKRMASPNVTFTGGLSESELIDYASRAKVYLQVSRHEAFGCSLAEAMLCECVPVVSKAGAIPEVVGDCGLYVDSFSPDEIAGKVKEAAARQKELGPRARQRIIEKFPLEERKKQLLAVVESIITVKKG